MLNSTTWLYGAEVLPIALRSKIMGLAAASHFIVNVAGSPPSSVSIINSYTDITGCSHRSRPKRIRQHPRELLLCFCRMHAFLLGYCIFLLPVSISSS